MTRTTGSLIALTLAALPSWAMAADAAHGGAKPPPLLSADPGTAIWTLILFVLVLVVLGKFVWPPILKGLQGREEKIRGDIHSAEAANKQAQATLDQYKQQLAEAHAESRKLLDQARIDAETVRQRLTAAAEAEAAKLRERATADISAAKNQAVQELYARAAELSVAVAGKILQRQINDSDVKSLIDRSLTELEQKKAG